MRSASPVVYIPCMYTLYITVLLTPRVKNGFLYFFLFFSRIFISSRLFILVSCLRNAFQFNAALDASADLARGIRNAIFEERNESFGLCNTKTHTPRGRDSPRYLGAFPSTIDRAFSWFLLFY